STRLSTARRQLRVAHCAPRGAAPGPRRVNATMTTGPEPPPPPLVRWRVNVPRGSRTMRHRSAVPFLSLSLLLAGAPALPAAAQPAQPLDLHQVMADPDWIGAPVERMWWSWDGATAYYVAKRSGSSVRDTF